MLPDSRYKIEKYQAALIKAAGFDLLPDTQQTETYDLIIEPAFHAACGIRLCLMDDVGELMMVLFSRDSQGELFDAIWREDYELAEFEILRCIESRRCSIAILSASNVAEIRQRIDNANPWSFRDPPDDVNCGRDGIGGLGLCHKLRQVHTFRFATCEEELSSLQLEYISIFLEEAVLAFGHQDTELRYLSALNHYGL